MPLFGEPHQIIRGPVGSWVGGNWIVPSEPAPIAYELDVQPATVGDVESVRAMPGGATLSGLLRAYGGLDAPLKEGDILLYDNARWVCISAPPARRALGSETAHIRYLFTRQIEVGG